MGICLRGNFQVRSDQLQEVWDPEKEVRDPVQEVRDPELEVRDSIVEVRLRAKRSGT
jgi:hypothetical protein